MSHLTRITTAGLLAASEQGEPPISVHKIAGELGITIERRELPMAGFTARIRDRWYIWVNTSHGPRRRRFTAAHEIGHVALGHHGVVFLFDGEPAHQRAAANRFAAELLMPEDLVRREHTRAVEAGLSVVDLADVFLVDKRVAELRLEELSLQL